MPGHGAESDIYAKKADELFNRGEYEKALIVIREGLAAKPDSQYLLDLEHMALRQMAGVRKKFLLIGIIAVFLLSLCALVVYGLLAYLRGDAGLYKVVGHCSTPGFAYDVCVSGDYAYVADGEEGLCIIDVSNPEKPMKVGYCNIPGISTGLDINAPYAYVAAGKNGVLVVDVSNPEAPRIVAGCPGSDSAYNVQVRKSLAHITGAMGYCIFDISNPKKPVFLAKCWTGVNCRHVHAEESCTLVTGLGSGYPLSVVDTADLGNLKLVGGYRISGSGDFLDETKPENLGSGNVLTPNGFYKAGFHLYIADRNAGLRIVDISDLHKPFETGHWSGQNSIWAWDVEVKDSRAYLTSGTEGLCVIDISDSAKPELVATCAIRDKQVFANNTRTFELIYSSEIRITLKGRHAYLAAGREGLFVIRISE